MKANISVENGRVLMSLDIPVNQVSLGKIEMILNGANRDDTKDSFPYPRRVCDDPNYALAGLFRNIESQDVKVRSILFPPVAQQVIEAHRDFKDGTLWEAECTFTLDRNCVIVIGEGFGKEIEIQCPWE